MLDATQKDRLLQLFAEGVELPDAARPAFVARACAGDPELQRELGELLEVEAKALAGFLAAPAVAPATAGAIAAIDAPTAEPVPPRLPEIDGYSQFERIAEGGMGTVYRAVQLRPVRRTVAIKLIRPGMDTDTVLARFAVERQALALMSHPYIAAVYDAGTDAMGRPFLAMEFVDGVPITDYCERERLPLDDRLRLFVKVCGAVDHAHRRGVLHRDLKPSNVLVARRGDEAMPKVIDFGIAKALEEPLGEQSIHTLAGTFLGTPDYMAPEQIDGDVHRIDTRADVYSLGVVLYELVTGVRPIEAATLPVSGVVQMSKLVRETVPQKPSTRLRQRAAGASGPAPDQPSRWARRIVGDLDWIVMRALEKEPDRRYVSPRELAQDVERFLEHRPVSAGPPSGLYQLRKFARRYRVQVVAGVLVLLSLVLGLSGTLWFLVESKSNEAAAVDRARQAEGVRIAAVAALVAKDNPNLALLLALAAKELTDDSAVRQSIYDALPNHGLRQRLVGHDFGINQGGGVHVQFLADGRLVGSGASDAVLWDAATGTQLRRFAGPRDGIGALAISPDERLLLAASHDGRAYLWDLETGATLRTVEDHTAELRSCAFAADGKRFVTTSIDGTARVYATREQRQPVLLRHGHAVGPVAFDPSGNRLVTLAADRRTRIWDAATGRLELECAPGARTDTIGDEALRGAELFLLPGIERIVSSCGTILVHTTGGALVAEIQAEFPRRLGDDRLFCSADGCLGTVDLRSGEIQRHQELRLLSATPTPDGRFAVAIDHKYDMCLLDLSSNQIVRRYLAPADKQPRPPIAFHPNGKEFAVLMSEVHVWNLEPEFAPFDIPGAKPTYFAQSPAWGRMPIAVIRPEAGPHAQRWEVWDAAARRRLCEIRRPGMSFLEPSPCGTKLIGGMPAPDDSGTVVVVFDLAGRPLRELRLAARSQPGLDVHPGLQLAIDRTGSLLVTTELAPGQLPLPREGVRLQCHDLDTGALLAEIPHVGGVPTWVGPRSSGLVAMAGWGLRYFEVLDWRTGRVRARVSRPPDGMHLAAAVSPDGRYLLGTLGEPLAFVWDLEADGGDLSNHPIVTYTGLNPAGSYPCGFLDNGRLCWVVCNYEVHLFECRTGKTFAVLRLPDTCIHVAESPDSAQIVAQTAGGRVQRFPLDPLATARRLAVGQLDGKRLEQYRIGTPEQRRAAERVHLLANGSPGNHAKLGALALADGDLDLAIACYQRGADLGVLGPYYAYLYLDLVGLYCRRLDGARCTAAQRTVDLAAAVVALRQALTCGATPEDVLALPAIGQLRGQPGVDELLGR